MTEWFEKKPGEVPTQKLEEGGYALLLSEGPPDWVRSPPTLGGEKLKVIGQYARTCPLCDQADPDNKEGVRILELEKDYHVAECLKGHGYVWFKLK